MLRISTSLSPQILRRGLDYTVKVPLCLIAMRNPYG
jgi:hypothetical protein